MKKILFTIGILFTFLSNAQIYSNGNLATGITTARDDAAPDGYQWSEVQANIGDLFTANATLGQAGFYNNALTANFLIADDFTVPVGETWNITSFDFFGFATDFGLTPLGNPVDVLRIQIYSSDPSIPGATLIAGSATQNVFDLSNSPESFLYRTSYTIGDVGVAPDLMRKVWNFRGNLSTTLSAGTYWVVYQVHAVDNFGIFFPPNTIVGSRGLPNWNSRTRRTSGLWENSKDPGLPASIADTPLDYPFNVNGTISSLGLSSNDLVNKIRIFPNPATTIINVKAEVEVDAIEVYDVSGRLVLEKAVNDRIYSLNISELQSGNYFLKLKSNENVVIKKFIKI